MRPITITTLLVACVASTLAFKSASLEDPKPVPVPEKEVVRSVDKGDKGEIGKVAPDFTLKDLDGKEVKLSAYKGKQIVLEWFNPECPYVVYAYGDNGPTRDMRTRYAEQGIVWLTINSGAPGNQGTDPKVNKAFLEKYKLQGSVLVDSDGKVGRAYAAKTTPHMYLIDAKGVLVYTGALDNAPLGNIEGGGDIKINHVDAALLDLADKRPVKIATTRPYGCSVKYGKESGT